MPGVLFEGLYHWPSSWSSALRNWCTTASTTTSRSPIRSEGGHQHMKEDQNSWGDNITGGMLQDGEDTIIAIVTNLYNWCLSEDHVPICWKNAAVVVFQKKGDKSNIKNPLQFSLLSIFYRVFSYIIARRMLRTLDHHHAREQARFRSWYSTIGHLKTVSQFQEKTNEYDIPPCLPFVNYKKSVDCIEFTPLFPMLKNRGTEATYIDLVQNVCNGATAMLNLHQDSNKIKLEKDVSQRDNIAPRLFTCVSRMPSSTRSTGKIKELILMESILPASTLQMISSVWLTHHRSWRRRWMTSIPPASQSD